MCIGRTVEISCPPPSLTGLLAYQPYYAANSTIPIGDSTKRNQNTAISAYFLLFFFGFVTEVFKDEAGPWGQAKSITQARPEVDHFACLRLQLRCRCNEVKGTGEGS